MDLRGEVFGALLPAMLALELFRLDEAATERAAAPAAAALAAATTPTAIFEPVDREFDDEFFPEEFPPVERELFAVEEPDLEEDFAAFFALDELLEALPFAPVLLEALVCEADFVLLFDAGFAVLFDESFPMLFDAGFAELFAAALAAGLAADRAVDFDPDFVLVLLEALFAEPTFAAGRVDFDAAGLLDLEADGDFARAALLFDEELDFEAFVVDFAINIPWFRKMNSKPAANDIRDQEFSI